MLKHILLTPLLIPAIFCNLSAFAAPVEPRATAAQSPESLEKIAVDKAVAYMRGLNPSINPSCFYSGSTGDYQAQISLTEAWIGKKDTKIPVGCRVIGEIVENFAKANPEHIRDWSTVSKVFAESVSGKVYVLLGEMIDPDSIWLKYERGALKNNGRVTEVEVWKVEADGKLKKTNKTKETM